MSTKCARRCVSSYHGVWRPRPLYLFRPSRERLSVGDCAYCSIPIIVEDYNPTNFKYRREDGDTSAGASIPVSGALPQIGQPQLRASTGVQFTTSRRRLGGTALDQFSRQGHPLSRAVASVSSVLNIVNAGVVFPRRVSKQDVQSSRSSALQRK